MKFSHRIIIAVFALSVLVIGGIGFVAFPLFRSIQINAQELREQKARVQEARSLDGYLFAFANLSSQEKAELGEFAEMFVDPETPIAFIEFLESIAQSSDMELKITPGNPIQIKGQTWPEMDFQLASQGSYSGFIRFLKKLENAPYILEVRNTTVNQSKKEGGQVNFTMVLRAFTAPLKELNKKQ